ncbi:uncharacterized protein LOC121727709 [Aricia agestis]|uniref:uncharacterized protein LOC121727709 n=1 Tax=Aricia agestis TaxID=91739 RepID=UPI001C20B269|nr:uncharacterized protein LOC121727709 [Aricia agestis]
MLKYLVFFFVFRVCMLASVGNFDNPFVEINADDSEGIGGDIINGDFYQTVKSYYCKSTSTANQELLVYGSSAWTFPLQDVNLTLQYPPSNGQTESDEEYTITELRVMLYMEGHNSRGYITKGGLMQNNIGMTFIVGNVTRLSYHFWLYGVPDLPSSATENYNAMHHQMC